jgi:hypothetical protein
LGSACKRCATISTTPTTSLEHITDSRPLCMLCIVSLSKVWGQYCRLDVHGIASSPS